MDILINLLPQELKVNKKQLARKSLIIRLSLVLMIVAIFLSGLSLGLGIFQKINLRNANTRLSEAESKVSNFQEQGGLILVLKKRLEKISSLINTESPQVQAFNLTNTLTPSGVKLSSFNLDKKGQVLMSGESINSKALQSFFDNLAEPALNEGKIKNIRVDSLNKGANSNIKFDLIITLFN